MRSLPRRGSARRGQHPPTTSAVRANPMGVALAACVPAVMSDALAGRLGALVDTLAAPAR